MLWISLVEGLLETALVRRREDSIYGSRLAGRAELGQGLGEVQPKGVEGRPYTRSLAEQ